MSQLQNIIENAFEQRDNITPGTVSQEIKTAVEETLLMLDRGEARVADLCQCD